MNTPLQDRSPNYSTSPVSIINHFISSPVRDYFIKKIIWDWFKIIQNVIYFDKK